MMRSFFILFSSLITDISYGEFTADKITYRNKIDLENSNSWAFGRGSNNFIMHGDLRSIR